MLYMFWLYYTGSATGPIIHLTTFVTLNRENCCHLVVVKTAVQAHLHLTYNVLKWQQRLS